MARETPRLSIAVRQQCPAGDPSMIYERAVGSPRQASVWGVPGGRSGWCRGRARLTQDGRNSGRRDARDVFAWVRAAKGCDLDQAARYAFRRLLRARIESPATLEARSSSVPGSGVVVTKDSLPPLAYPVT